MISLHHQQESMPQCLMMDWLVHRLRKR
jgi:hypothetical protein